VVGTRSDGHQVIRESLNTVRADGMRSDHHTQVVTFQERVEIVRAKVYDVVLFLWVSHIVVLKSTLFFSFMRVTPEKVKNFLMIFRMISSKFDFEWSLDLLDPFNVLNGWTNASVTTEDS